MSDPLRIVAAGDHFVQPRLIARALAHELPEQAVAVRELTLGRPLEPFGPVAEVQEACGTQDQVIAALEDGAEVLVTQRAPVTERVLDRAGRLRLVVVCRGGPVNVNVDAARTRDVGLRPLCAGRDPRAAHDVPGRTPHPVRGDHPARPSHPGAPGPDRRPRTVPPPARRDGGERGPRSPLGDRVVLTPHLGGASRAVAEKAAATAAAEVGRWARGEPLAHSLS